MPSKYAQLNDKGWLEEKYLEERLSALKIGGIVECHGATVLRAIKRFGIPMRNQSETLKGLNISDERLLDKEWLEEHYLGKKETTYEIGDFVGCSAVAISRALKRFDIPIRPPTETSIKYVELSSKEWLYNNYWTNGKSCQKIANEIGCSFATVRKALQRFGIDRRDRSECKVGEANPFWGCQHSEETKQMISEANSNPSEETRKKMREACKHRVSPTHHTKPEMIWQGIVIDKHSLPFKYTGDGAFWIGENPTINPDFIHLTKKIAVEIFSYWHDPLRRHCKVRYSATLGGRKKILKKYGWKMIVFWQEDLEREDAEKYVLSVLKREKVI